jgi:hypothetical protein
MMISDCDAIFGFAIRAKNLDRQIPVPHRLDSERNKAPLLCVVLAELAIRIGPGSIEMAQTRVMHVMHRPTPYYATIISITHDTDPAFTRVARCIRSWQPTAKLFLNQFIGAQLEIESAAATGRLNSVSAGKITTIHTPSNED